SGGSKIVEQCSLPVTALGAVDVIITELAVFRFPNGRLTLTGLMPGSTLDRVREQTDTAFEVAL
ncbi:MAG: succinyl-CoA--3-ketoacid-CoA transferase, partial [Pseudomonadota bacterium]